MKLMQRSQTYKASNVEFNPKTLVATSYGWWKFVAVVEGKVIFNAFNYSNTTVKHQYKVRSLLAELGITIDQEVRLPKGIVESTLEELYLNAEEFECDEILNQELKKQERALNQKHARDAKRLTDYLENQVAFRDYEIKQARQFGHINTVAVHQVVEMSSMEHDVNNALHSFSRDGFSTVVFYV